MQKTLLAALVLLILVLWAALLRVQNREQQLEARLAAAERVRVPRPAPAPAVEAPATTSKPPPPEDRVFLEEKISPPPLTMTTPRPVPEAAQGQTILLFPQEAAAGRRPGYLGVSGVDVDGGGVRITTVLPGSVAEYSGLRVDDVILEVNGEKVGNYGGLAALVQKYGEGGPVTLRIRRGASEFYQGAQLGPRPP